MAKKVTIILIAVWVIALLAFGVRSLIEKGRELCSRRQPIALTLMEFLIPEEKKAARTETTKFGIMKEVKYFNSDGNVYLEKNYLWRIPHGKFRVFYPDGKVYREGQKLLGITVMEKFYYPDGSAKSPLVDKLERRVSRMSFGGNVHMHTQAKHFFNLAKAYLKDGQKKKARAVLETGLSLAPFNYEEQFLLARMDIDDGYLPQAISRLRFIERTSKDKKLVSKAKNLIKKYPVREDLIPTNVLPKIDRILYLARTEDMPRDLAKDMAGIISKEFALKVQVIDEAYRLPEDSLAIRPSKQLDADFVLKKAIEHYQNILDLEKTFGVLLVTARDMTANDLNFIFGTADIRKRAGIMSVARFASGNPTKEVLLGRAVKQAFSTIGFIAGIGRCTMPECARAYPHSLSDLDRKSTKICDFCFMRLMQIYRKIQNQ